MSSNLIGGTKIKQMKQYVTFDSGEFDAQVYSIYYSYIQVVSQVAIMHVREHKGFNNLSLAIKAANDGIRLLKSFYPEDSKFAATLHLLNIDKVSDQAVKTLHNSDI